MNDIIRVLVIAPEVESGLVHQRITQIYKHLDRKRYQLTFTSTNEIGPTEIAMSDVCVFVHPYAEVEFKLLWRISRYYNKKVIVDIDDLLDNLPVGHPAYALFQKNSFHAILRSANQIVASTDYLKMAIAHHNQNIVVIENTIDTDRYKMFMDLPKPAKKDFVIGWTGSASHLEDFLGITRPLARFMNDHPEVNIFLHGICSEYLMNTYGSRVRFLASFIHYFDFPAECSTYNMDVCLVPLVDCPFNHAKSDLRLLDMAPFNVPLIASAADNFKRHEKDGRLLIARTEDDWYNQLKFAYENPKEMAKMAKTAREYVMTERLVSSAVTKWDYVLQAVVGGRTLSNLDSLNPPGLVYENANPDLLHATL